MLTSGPFENMTIKFGQNSLTQNVDISALLKIRNIEKVFKMSCNLERCVLLDT